MSSLNGYSFFVLKFSYYLKPESVETVILYMATYRVSLLPYPVQGG